MTRTPEEEARQRVLQHFDADSFMLAEYEEATETNRTLLPEGSVKIDLIKDFELIKPKLFTDPGSKEQFWLRPTLRLHLVITDQGLLEMIGCRTSEYVWRYGMKLDINENGKLDMGPNRNLDLGKLRAAIGQNIPGIPWNLLMLKNQGPLGVTIQHRLLEGRDEPFENISKWYKWGEEADQEEAA